MTNKAIPPASTGSRPRVPCEQRRSDKFMRGKPITVLKAPRSTRDVIGGGVVANDPRSTGELRPNLSSPFSGK